MARPQLENGHTDIANELLEALCRIRIPGEARQVLDVIFRKTYGWHKKEDAISLTQFVAMTGMNKPHIIESLRKLLAMNLIIEKGKAVTEKGNEFGRIYGINKDYETWRPLPKKVTLPKKVKPVTEKGNAPLPKKVPTKETSAKEKKERYAALFDIFWDNYPARDGKKVGKAVAFEYYCLLKEGELPLCNEAAKNYAESKQARDGYARDPERFLLSKKGRIKTEPWREWTEPAKAVSGPGQQGTPGCKGAVI